MKDILKFYKKFSLTQKIILSFSVVFLLFSRLYLINSIPATIPHDEMIYAVQAKSYALQGKTLDQTHRPWQLTPFDHMYAELPATLMSLGFLMSQDPLAATHMTSALMGLSLPFILSCIFYSLWKDRRLSLAIFVVAVFNPLLWQFSRLGYDAWYSLWFYMMGALFFVHKDKRKNIISALFFAIGFFNYQGFKLLLFPWVTVLLSLLLVSENKLSFSTFKSFISDATKQIKKHYSQLAVLSFVLVITLFYGLVILPNQPRVNERLGVTIFSQSQHIAELTDLERRQALVSPTAKFHTNKVTVIGNFMFDRLLSAFNPHLLFREVEPGVSGFSVWVHGIFYWIEGVMILIGLVVILHKERTRLQGIILALAVATLSFPTLINSGGEWHLLRSMLSYTVLLFFAGWGLSWVLKQKKLLPLFFILYAIAIVNFSYIYFYRYPVISLDWANYHERILARYLTLSRQVAPDEKISIHVSQPDYFYWSYILYSDQITKENLSELAQVENDNSDSDNKKYKFNNLVFTNSCDIDEDASIIVAESSFRFCESRVSNLPENSGIPATITPDDPTPSRTYSALVAILDSGEKMYILDDQLCKDLKLKSFVHPTSIKDLNVEKLNQQSFCQSWVTKQ